MALKQRLLHELRAVTTAALYFGCWIAALILLKELVLAEYQIAFHRLSMALVGALILSKVVLVLEHVSFGEWLRARPAWVDVILRTALYAAGVVGVLVLEKGFEGRHEHGGFGGAVKAAFEASNALHIWANAICISGALLGYNALTVVRRHVGDGALLKMFLAPLPPKAEYSSPPAKHS
jgi:hypothetical protein